MKTITSTVAKSTSRTLAALLAAILVYSLGAAQAKDTDIYFSNPDASDASSRPNVLLILDTSGSMGPMNGNVGTTGMTRLDNMKEAIKAFLDSPEATAINVGLMRFSSNPGGPILFPVTDINAPANVVDGNVYALGASSADDAEESNSSPNPVTVSSATLELGNDSPPQIVGLRFRSVNIPKDATILSAKIVFTAAADGTGPSSLSIRGEYSGDAAAFTTADGSISARTHTSAAVAWSPGDWTSGTTQETPDVATVVQEIVNGPDWCGNNSMGFFVSGSGMRRAQAYDGGATGAPVLIVTYDPSTPVGGGCIRRDVQLRISNNNDDAEQRSASMRLSDNAIQLVRDSSTNQQVGFRFRNVPIPQGATILSAELEFTMRDDSSGSSSLTVYGHDHDNSPEFTSSNNNISSRTKTSASVAWNSIPNLDQHDKLISPDLATVVTAVTGRAGWAPGNSLSFIITGSGTREVYSRNDSSSRAAVLRISYTDSSSSSETVRERLKTIVDQFQAQGSTPTVDTLYEAALYYRGEQVDYGKIRGPQSGTIAEVTRVSHPASYTGASGVYREAGCTDADLNATACRTEEILGSPNYISPMVAGCQENHIVLLTDGEPTVNNSVAKIQGMTGETCGSTTPGEAQCSNELATYLATTDQSALSERQVVRVHTIGFNNDGDPEYLRDLAEAGEGGYYEASTANDLADVLRTITRNVIDAPTSFVSPSLSVNAFNRLFHRDEVYFSLFQPSLSVRWPGNIKKFTLCKGEDGDNCSLGDVIDSSGDPAIGTDKSDPNTYSKILDSAQSYWSSVADGPQVTAGGAGSNVPAYGSRRVYTYLGSADVPATPVNLATDSAQHVLTTNTTLRGTLGISGTTTADEDRKTAIIEWMRGKDVLDEDNDEVTDENRWVYADALHSRPATVTYGGTEANPVIKLFVGTNDGTLRMINAETGVEEWAIYFPEFLANQGTLMDDPNGEHLYGVDGTPTILTIDNNGNGQIEPEAAEGDKVYLYVGLRRGGRDIYAFDVTPTSELTDASTTGGVQPKFLWRIKGGTGDYKRLGQTWSRPRVANIRIECVGNVACDDNDSTTEDSAVKTVLIFGGGYDPSLDDVMPSGADGMGNAIYIVDPLTGARLWWAGGPVSGCTGRDCPDLELAKMLYAIPSDITMIDTNGDREQDRLYVGDTRGQLWRIDLNHQIDPAGSSTTQRNGGSTGYVLADVSCTGGNRSDHCADTPVTQRRKFYYPPSVVPVNDPDYSTAPNYDMIVIGTGDREDPIDRVTDALSVDPVQNRLYVIRDYDYRHGSPATIPASPITDANLADITDTHLGELTGTDLDAVKASKGWYLDLREASSPQWIGEKNLSETTVFDGTIYATTYVPAAGSGGCESAAEGTARGYKINYLTGAAVEDFDEDGTEERYEVLGGGIPAEYVVVIREEGVSSLVGTSGGGKASIEDSELPRYQTYWYDE